MIQTTLIRSGRGRKDSNAALADEFFATLDATHGNSAQAKSLQAMLKRAEERLARKAARKASKASEKAAEPTAAERQAAEDTIPAPRDTDDEPHAFVKGGRFGRCKQCGRKDTHATHKVAKPKRESNAQARERRQRIAEDNANAKR